MTVVVTGGAGFIGSNVVAALEEEGETEIVVVDRLGSEGKWRNLAKRELAEIVDPGDLGPWLDRHGEGVRALVHLGAVTSTTSTDADHVVATNVRLPLRLWRWCAAHGVPFLYASSAATYGDGSGGFDDDPSPEALARLRPRNLYGWSKHLFDRRAARIAARTRQAPPQWVGLKFFNVYGPNEYHKGPMRSLVAKAFPAAARGNAVELFASDHPDYADGGQMRDFIYVEDCARILLWFLDHPEVSGIFNVGTGRARSWNELVAALYRVLGAEPRIEYVPMPEELRGRYQYFTEAKLVRLRKAGCALSFRSVEEGVEDYVQRFLDTDDPYR